ncbi:MAG: type II/IV secretion system ATPase subunit [Candidatus Aenigmarchaeota archaeon]|nr:type II/IV secretion system ATPase subunit [Candidatus Aenigmarchaeota archaeon]
MTVDYEVVDNVIRINALNWAIEPSIEDSEAAMGIAIDTLLEVKNAERIVFAESRETEYDYEQVKILLEIANAYNKILNEDKLISIQNLGPPQCEKFFPRRLADLQFLILEVLRKDPIGAYFRLHRMITQEKILADKAIETSKICHTAYLDSALSKIEKILSSTRLIQMAKPYLSNFKPGDRTLYREIFHPLIKPNFMLTRYMMIPPKEGQRLGRYIVGNGILVEIFKVPGAVRNVYHVTPPEFRLSEAKYTILDNARRYLGAHKPTETEFTEPEKTREIFFNIGKDLVKELAASSGVELTAKEIDELATILSRYTAGFGVLEVLLADDKIQDIYINSPVGFSPIYISHADFEDCETNLIPTKEDAEAWATRFRLISGRPLDEANPVLDTELDVEGGRARVAAITKTLSPEALAFALRRHRDKPWTFPLFIQNKYLDPLYAGVMSFIIDGGRSILVAGGRSSGKTSLLSSMMLELMKKFRIITVEDTLELPVVALRKLSFNIQRMKSRSVITRVEAELPADEALRTALRLGDSVLIVGEVRSVEAKALYEAMRIGALANVVAGTIHGESAYGVFDRVVNDLGVPPTSFKATDIITLANLLHSPDGLHRFRRVFELTEVRKHWKTDPVEEGGFVTLMEYSAKEDRLKPTDTLIDGESWVINEISRRVREWRGNWDAVWDNILLRAKIKETTVEYAKKLKRDDILEADWTVNSNEMFHLFSDQSMQELGGLDSKVIYERWLNWYENKLKRS